MPRPPHTHLHQMHVQVAALLDGVSGPLTPEQKTLAQAISSTINRLPDQLELMLDLSQASTPPGLRQVLRQDLSYLLEVATNYADLLHSGAAGPLTRGQHQAVLVILGHIRRLHHWAVADWGFPLN
jgi:hypothetical protein